MWLEYSAVQRDGQVVTNKMLLVELRSPYPEAWYTPGVVSDGLTDQHRAMYLSKARTTDTGIFHHPQRTRCSRERLHRLRLDRWRFCGGHAANDSISNRDLASTFCTKGGRDRCERRDPRQKHES